MIRRMSSSLIQLVYVVLSFGVLMALVMITKLVTIYPCVLKKVAKYLDSHGGGNWYRYNKEAMKMGLRRMLSAVIIVWAIGIVILLLCLPDEFRRFGLIGGVLCLFIAMIAELKTSFRVGKLDCVDAVFDKMIYFRDAHGKSFTCPMSRMYPSEAVMMDLRAKALMGRHFAVLKARFYNGAMLIDKTEWED